MLRRGLVASIGQTTLWRWLSEDAIRPWSHRSWIFPRAPDFEEKASRALDLYAGVWRGRRLDAAEFVICADEKTSIQARRRLHPSSPPAPGRPIRVEHSYVRRGAWAYLAAWDVRRARIFGRCEPRTNAAAFDRLVDQVMGRQPYHSARRVFWILDNASYHRGEPCTKRLRKRWPNLRVAHLPVHASWLNQVEIYFSIVQRKVLTPNDFASLVELRDCLLRFQRDYQRVARPFDWNFKRSDLTRLLRRLKRAEPALPKAA